MSKVIVGLSVSVDGDITGRDSGAGCGLGDAPMLFDWYFNGDQPSEMFDEFRLSQPSARVFDALASRAGASLAGRTAYDDSGWSAGGTLHPNAPLVVLGHRPAPRSNDRQIFISTGTDDAVATARGAAGDTGVGLMGGGAAPGVTHLHYEVVR